MRPALARHDEMLRAAIEAHVGYVVKTTGDGFHAAFATAADAVDAAVAAQLGLGRASRGGDGSAAGADGGPHRRSASCATATTTARAVNRAARLMSVAHGGQIVVSLATSELVRDAGRRAVRPG